MDNPISTRITTEPLHLASAHRMVANDRCGAVVSFTGVIRNHDEGREVVSIDYSSHPSAEDILLRIATQFIDHPGVHRIVAHHRVGTLTVGDVALLVVVAAEHRAQAISTAESIVEEIKLRLPVWKKQRFSDGHHAWTGLPS